MNGLRQTDWFMCIILSPYKESRGSVIKTTNLYWANLDSTPAGTHMSQQEGHPATESPVRQ